MLTRFIRKNTMDLLRLMSFVAKKSKATFLPCMLTFTLPILAGCSAYSGQNDTTKPQLTTPLPDETKVSKKSPETQPVQHAEPYILPSVKVSTFTSKYTNKTYKLFTKSPKNYHSAKESYPVIYVLDAHAHYQHLISAHANYLWDGLASEAIIIGVTWQAEQPQIAKLRQEVFTPSQDGNVLPSGGAKSFLSFLQQELIPATQAQYRTNGQRTLTGSSYSGLFCLYALFDQPQLFDNIVALSPSLWWHNKVITEHLQAFSQRNLTKKTTLFIARGEYETASASSINNFVNELNQLHKEHLYITNEVVLNAGHSSVNAQGFARALGVIFEQEHIQLSQDVLAAYTGTYEGEGAISNGVFRLENGVLLFKDQHNISYPLLAETQTKFFIKAVPVSFSFTDKVADKTHQVTVTFQGQHSTLQRVKAVK